MNHDSLTGRAGIVTGGGSGLGQAVACVLASHGSVVAVADIDAVKARSTVMMIREGPGRAAALELDVTDEDSCRRGVQRALADWGRIDFLINCAGIDVTQSVGELSTVQWDNVLGVNLRGPFLMSREVLSPMQSQGGGHIVNIVSTAGKRAWPNASAYHASKWGLLGLSHALHSELRSHGIKVTAVVAGGMRTPFLLDRFPDIPEVMVLPMKETSWP
jgi:NAD(P)-dependent dehydrogenase (short-subunit alcohol dehydrogenase family)